MYHHGNVHAVQQAADHEFHLAAHVLDHALLAQIFTEGQLDHLLGWYHNQTDGAAQAIQSARLLQCGSDAQQSSGLAVVAAAVGHTVDRLGVVGNVQGIQLAEDGQLGAGTAGVHLGVEAGDIAGQGEGVAQGLILFHQVVVGFPLGEAGLGVCPEPALGIQDHLAVLFYILNQLLLSLSHGYRLLSKGTCAPCLYNPHYSTKPLQEKDINAKLCSCASIFCTRDFFTLD